MNALDDVPAVVEHSPNILRVDGAGEVWIAVMPTVTSRCGNPLKSNSIQRQLLGEHYKTHKEFASNEIFRSDDFSVLGSRVESSIIGQLVVGELRKIRL